jgi:endonuclease/exonuclease/phosphatase family metal-dependent hydrolase
MRRRTLLFLVVLAALILPALALTLLRLLQPGGDVGVRMVSFAPLALPAYLAALVLVLVRVVATRDRRWVAGALALLVGAGLHAWWLSPQYAGEVPAAADGAPSVTVMTLNIQSGEADPPRVVETAARERAEVLVLEEITPEALAQLERYGISQAFPYRAGEAADVRDGTMVFSVHRLARTERIPTRLGAWAADVVTPAGPLRLYAVHVESPTIGSAAWGRDLATLRRLADADPELDLMVGDFNATADHEPFRRLLDSGWRSAAEATNEGWDPTWPDNGERSVLFVPLPRLVQIDHVLVAPSMAAVDTRTGSVQGTDHRMVVAEVAFR